MNKQLLPNHPEDLQRTGLSNETIHTLGFYSGATAEIKAILGFEAVAQRTIDRAFILTFSLSSKK